MPEKPDARQGRGPAWRLSGGGGLCPAPFLVAGIVNATPDSFSDGGYFLQPDAALVRIRRMVAEGADIVDIGAESSRPGAEDIGAAEEWRRLFPVLEKALAMRQEPSDGETFALSVDSFRASTVAAALSLLPGNGEKTASLACVPCGRGVDIINDISGASFDPAMPETLGAFKPGYVLGHSPARPDKMRHHAGYGNIVDELLRWFNERMAVLVKAGLPEECICLDPCIGFGKNLAHNLSVIRGIPRFAALGRPLYFGISRKSFLGEITGQPLEQRDTSSQALIALLAYAGVAVHRTHQVADTVATLKIVQALQSENA